MYRILITYDISDNKRRTKVEKIISSYGYRVNYSVFELTISKSDLDVIVSKLSNISTKDDNIRLYFINKDTLKKSFVINSKHGVFSYEQLYF